MKDAIEIEESLLTELEISSDLGYEFTRQAPFYAHWAFLHARSEDAVRKSEEKLDVLFAQLYRVCKKKNPEAKENDAKSFIRTRREHKDVVKELNAAKFARDMLKAAVRAFDMRHSMLIQLGMDRRKELDETDSQSVLSKKIKKASKVVRKTYSKGREGKKHG